MLATLKVITNDTEASIDKAPTKEDTEQYGMSNLEEGKGEGRGYDYSKPGFSGAPSTTNLYSNSLIYKQ